MTLYCCPKCGNNNWLVEIDNKTVTIVCNDLWECDYREDVNIPSPSPTATSPEDKSNENHSLD